MAAYRRVYDSRHLQADCQEPAALHTRPTNRLETEGTTQLYATSSRQLAPPLPRGGSVLGALLHGLVS